MVCGIVDRHLSQGVERLVRMPALEQSTRTRDDEV